MKFFLSIALLFASWSFLKKCNTDSPEVPKKYYDFKKHNFTVWNDTLFLNGHRFSGYVFELQKNGKDTSSVFAYRNGFPEGIQKRWYSDNVLMEYREYSSGKKNGKQIAYWPNGKLRFSFTAFNDVNEGEMKEWDYNGNLSHLGSYKNGQEEGVQKMWYPNGKIRSNYIIKNGRRYGLLGTKNCRNVSDSLDLGKPGDTGL